jgi:hypothetical protein
LRDALTDVDLLDRFARCAGENRSWVTGERSIRPLSFGSPRSADAGRRWLDYSLVLSKNADLAAPPP